MIGFKLLLVSFVLGMLVQQLQGKNDFGVMPDANYDWSKDKDCRVAIRSHFGHVCYFESGEFNHTRGRIDCHLPIINDDIFVHDGYCEVLKKGCFKRCRTKFNYTCARVDVRLNYKNYTKYIKFNNLCEYRRAKRCVTDFATLKRSKKCKK